MSVVVATESVIAATASIIAETTILSNIASGTALVDGIGTAVSSLGKSTNASKGAKNWTDWIGHSKLGEVPADVRKRMLELEALAKEALSKAIKKRLKK